MDEIKADLFVAGKMNGVSSWVIKEISNGFGTFKRRACENCGHMRAQMPLTFCGYCGYKMTNVEEVECVMPDDGQQVLISTKWSDEIDIDVCTRDPDYGIGLEDRGDWDGVLAWMPVPKKYKQEGES